MILQHVNIKIFAAHRDIDLAQAIPVFHRWIQESTVPELLIDVANYKHVPDGPGVMLIGHEADYSLDETGGRLGLLYNRKAVGDGDARAALVQAHTAAVAAAKRLELEPEFAGKLRFDYNDLAVIINDRMLAPNTDETWDALRPEFESFFATVFGEHAFALERLGEPRDRFSVRVSRK